MATQKPKPRRLSKRTADTAPALAPPSAKPSDKNKIKRVMWYPPNPNDVSMLMAATLDETGNKILAKALRDIAKGQALQWAHPRSYDMCRIPEGRDDVITWLEQMRHDIDHAIRMLRTQPMAAPQFLLDQIGPDYQAECAQCRETFIPNRRTARYCSDACRQRAHRARKTAAE